MTIAHDGAVALTGRAATEATHSRKHLEAAVAARFSVIAPVDGAAIAPNAVVAMTVRGVEIMTDLVGNHDGIPYGTGVIHIKSAAEAGTKTVAAAVGGRAAQTRAAPLLLILAAQHPKPSDTSTKGFSTQEMGDGAGNVGVVIMPIPAKLKEPTVSTRAL